MANTERLMAIQQIHILQKQVENALNNEILTSYQRNLLDDLSDHLIELDTFLLMSDLKLDIQALKEKSTKLKALNKRSKKQFADIKKLAAAIDTTTKIVGKITKAMGFIAEAGLLAAGSPA